MTPLMSNTFIIIRLFLNRYVGHIRAHIWLVRLCKGVPNCDQLLRFVMYPFMVMIVLFASWIILYSTSAFSAVICDFVNYKILTSCVEKAKGCYLNKIRWHHKFAGDGKRRRKTFWPHCIKSLILDEIKISKFKNFLQISIFISSFISK